MALPLFSTWNFAEVTAAIRDLEAGVALGASSIQYPNQGAMQMVSRAEAMQTLRGLYRRRDEILSPSNPAIPDTAGVRFVRGIPRRGL